MDTKEAAHARAELLKQLRTQHKSTVEHTQNVLKEQKHIYQAVCKSLREKPKTVPEIATDLEMPPDRVLWYVTSYKKYGLLIENGMCGDYPLYERAGEKSE